MNMNGNGLFEESSFTDGVLLTQDFSLQLETCFRGDENRSVYDEEPTTDSLQLSAFMPPEILTAFLTPRALNWKESSLYMAYLLALNLGNVNGRDKSPDLEANDADDEELSFAFDHHSLITSQLPFSDDEPVKMADEVIREIDLIMGHTEDVSFPSLPEIGDCDSSPLPVNQESGMLSETGLQQLPLNVLNNMLDDAESCVLEYSANLVQELAYREELEFEQEQKDIFIARLDELHRRLERRFRRSSLPPLGGRGRGVILRQSDGSPHSVDHFEPRVNPSKLHCHGAKTDHNGEEIGNKWPSFPTKLSTQKAQDMNVSESQAASRAHLAAQAAAAVASSATSLLRRQWRRFSRGPDELSLRRTDPPQHPRQSGNISTTVPVQPRAVILARFRKWARSSRPTDGGESGSLTDHGGSLSARHPGHQHHHHYYYPPCLREARSAVTTPATSPSASLLMDDNMDDLPAVPCQLTHSASGHLMGAGTGDLANGSALGAVAGEMSVEDIEYKNLTTTIPYHRASTVSQEGPNVEQLQFFNEILLAILTNSPNLTNMLTDYILNVYAPADLRPSKLPI